MPLDLVQTLSELVATPSVNPMGREVPSDIALEHRVSDYLERLFDRLGIPCQRQRVEAQRDNIIARLDGRIAVDQGGKLLLWEAHQDTVPVDGMTIEPFRPVVRDGRLYGRGACDIKGGLTAMLGALARLAESRPPEMPTIILACTVNEEFGFTGATALTTLWTSDVPSIIPRKPDAAVIAEPTQLDVVVAHKGTARWRCHTHGRAAHSSQPHLGDNAVYKMGRVLAAIESYATTVAPTLPAHKLCGKCTLSVGTIRGGISINTVPDRCTIELDRRVLPGEQGQEAWAHVVEYVKRFAGINFPVEHEPCFLMGPSLSDEGNGPLADRLSAVARQRTGRGAKVGVPYGTDAGKISASGVPSVVFGPGSIDQAHTCDEWLSVDELQQASDVLYEFAKGGL